MLWRRSCCFIVNHALVFHVWGHLEDNSSSVASPTAFQSLPGHDGLSRDLLAAKDAYKHGDARASMLAHGSRVGPGVSVSDEKHGGCVHERLWATIIPH
jgi:hypothetical protein